MFLNEYVKNSRSVQKISQESFYKDIVSRVTADAFEKKNADVLKISALPKIAENLSITVNDLISRSEETFLTEFDNKNNDFIFVSTILSAYEAENVELEDNEIKNYIAAMEDLYTNLLEKKEQHTNYFNLYLLLKYSFHSMSNIILPVDRTDVTLLKKLIKDKSIYGTFDYKAFANIVISPLCTTKDIAFFVETLYPIEDSPSVELLEAAYLALANLASKLLRTNEFDLADKYLELFNTELSKNHSYRFKLNYLHDFYLLDFLKSKYTHAESLAKSLQFVDIIELCEPPESSFPTRMREATINMIEGKTSSRSIINIIATTKNIIDFKKLIPEHLLINKKGSKNLTKND